MTNISKACFCQFTRLAVAICCALAAYGCSGSSESGSTDVQSESEATNNAPSESTIIGPETINDAPTAPVITTTRVTFDITVPVYVSDALQVRLVWGEKDIEAGWVVDESWSASDDFPTATEHPLIVSFYDDNGGIVLASVEQSFRTGTNASETVQIVAAQFDSERWDNDDDGISNLAELLDGSDPLTESELASADTPGMTDSADTMDEPDTMHEFEEFNFVTVADDLIHMTSGCQMTRLSTVVEDLAYIIEDTNTITWPDNDWYQVQIVSNIGPTNTVFDTVCDGDAECKLLPGRHAVINHTTGQRTLLEVLPVELEDNPNAVQLPETVVTTPGTVFPPATVPLTRAQHNCELGGTFTREMGETDFDGATYNSQNFIFDQCQMTIRTGRLPDGNYRVNGELEVLNIEKRFRATRFRRFENFSVVGESGLEYHVQNGLLNDTNPSNRIAMVTSYEKILPSEEVGESLTDVAFSYNGRGDYLLNASGTIRSDKTADQQVTIRTDATLNFELDSNNRVLTPFNGSMEMLAEDGSMLHLNPVPMSTLSSLLTPVFTIDLDVTTRDGENITGSTESYRPSGSNGNNRICGYRNNRGDFRRSTFVEPIP